MDFRHLLSLLIGLLIFAEESYPSKNHENVTAFTRAPSANRCNAVLERKETSDRVLLESFQALASDRFQTTRYHALRSILREEPERLTDEQIALLTAIGMELLSLPAVYQSKEGKDYYQWDTPPECLFLIAKILTRPGVKESAKAQIQLLLKTVLIGQASHPEALTDFVIAFIKALRPGFLALLPETLAELSSFLMKCLRAYPQT